RDAAERRLRAVARGGKLAGWLGTDGGAEGSQRCVRRSVRPSRGYGTSPTPGWRGPGWPS
ncbi:hypothetical protein, partial [Streptomyces pseudogriseolus]|uniref:hypothetical protein n=1 Tax=Streptomyces pseudogriseolus TaxID=36817 RepID=UPI00348342F6